MKRSSVSNETFNQGDGHGKSSIYAYSWGLANAEEICRWHLNGCSLSPAPTIDSVLAASSVYISIGH